MFSLDKVANRRNTENMNTNGPTRANRAFGPDVRRTIHLIDIENLVGSGLPATEDVHATQLSLQRLLPVRSGDLVVIGAGPLALMPAYRGWAGARYVLRAGPDGADLALLAVINDEDIAGRFTAVTIASGDGIFTDAAVEMASRGCRVTVASRKESLSRRLRLAAHTVRYLPCYEPGIAALDHRSAA